MRRGREAWARGVGERRGREACGGPALMPSSRWKLPSNSVSTPARIFISVDLPAPFPPRMPILAPSFQGRNTPLLFDSN